MKLKSYFSATVEAAVELARKELGGDALLMNARPATPETRYLGAYEVVFGVPGASAPATPPLKPDDAYQDLRDGITELRQNWSDSLWHRPRPHLRIRSTSARR